MCEDVCQGAGRTEREKKEQCLILCTFILLELICFHP